MALVAAARRAGARVVASIFVNPKQFGANEDLGRYPRREATDAAMLAEAGCDLLWLPGVEPMYPHGFATNVGVAGVSASFDGAARPGHFDGVVTVVDRLFAIAKPDKAIFGEKDFQQLTIVKAMKSKVEIIGVPTVREFDGLAMSSRNLRLSESGRNVALVIHRALAAAKLAPTVEIAQEILNTTLSTEPGFDKDYATIIDEKDFSLADEGTENRRAIIAGWVEGVRLIDNMPMVGR
jgi:pantoate--beta-alanine ligase